jgi:hypothetical protein
MTTEYGYAAHYYDGTEYFDLGAGWPSQEEATRDLIAEGTDMDGVEIYYAKTTDNWTNWAAA